VEAPRLEVVARREMGVRPVESDFEIAPVLWRAGVVEAAGGAVLGVLILASLCVPGGALIVISGVSLEMVGGPPDLLGV